MKNFLLAVMATLVLCGCAGNVFEQKTKVYKSATAKIEAALNTAEVDEIVNSVEEEIDAIEQSEDWKAYEALVEANDTAALKDYEAAMTACRNAEDALKRARIAFEIAD